MEQLTEKQVYDLVNQYFKSLLGLTLRLVKIGNNKPQGVGSGFIWQHGDRNTLITVLHNFQPDENDKNKLDFQGWSIESDVIVKGRSVAINLPPIQGVRRVKLDGENVVDQGFVDIAWGDIDVDALKKKIAEEPLPPGKKIEFSAYHRLLDAEPNGDDLYAFCAQASQPVFLHQSKHFHRDVVYELGMTFAGVDDAGLYRFVVDGEHKGDAVYKGSSGSPIADEKGNVVALVKGGIKDDNVVLGVPLKGYGQIIRNMV